MPDDLTDLARAQRAIHALERRCQALLENSSDAIAVLAADGTVLYASPSTERMTGHTVREFKEKNAFALLHPEDVPRVRSRFYALLRRPGGDDWATYRARHKDGSWRWIEAVATNRLEEPTVAGVVVNFRDVTDRRRAEEALENSERRFRLLLEVAHDAIFVVDAAGTITWVTPATLRLVGATADELIGRNGLDFAHPDDRPLVSELLTRLAKEPRGTARLDCRAVRRDGTVLGVRITATNLIDEPAVRGIALCAHERQTSSS